MINIPDLPKPMTKKEKAQFLKNWNEDSWKVLAERNMRLALNIVKKFHNNDIEDDELFGVAQLGLVKAARTFDTGKKIKFTTYATHVITNEIFMRIRREKRHRLQSLNETVVFGHDRETCELGDLIACTKDPFEEMEERQFLEYIRNLLEKGDKKYREIILLSLDGLTQQEIADRIGISQAQVSRILKKYKDKCHDYMELG